MKRTAGFTMIEAIVIVAVIAILGGILTPVVVKELSKSKTTRVLSDMEAISTAFNQYYADTSVWPENFSGGANTRMDLVGFDCMYTNSQSLTGWDGPYMEKSVSNAGSQVVAYQNGTAYTGVIDSWGHPFRVVYGRVGSAAGGPAGAIALVSGGPDGTIATSDANVLAGIAQNDDLVRVITKRVR